MVPTGRRLRLILLLAAGLCLRCPAASASRTTPAISPICCPTGDIIHTHAKPPGPGYYANFDPHAIRSKSGP